MKSAFCFPICSLTLHFVVCYTCLKAVELSRWLIPIKIFIKKRDWLTFVGNEHASLVKSPPFCTDQLQALCSSSGHIATVELLVGGSRQ